MTGPTRSDSIPEEGPLPTTDDKRALATCCGAHVLHDGLVDMLYALLPFIAQAFGLSYAQVGMVRAANRVATASLQIPAGLLAERIGERGLLAAGTAVAGIGLLLLGTSVDRFPTILAMIFLAGVGAAFQHPLSSAIIARHYPAAGRRAALGVYNACGDIGKFAFMGTTILATAVGFSWHVPVVAYGLLAMASGAAILVALPRDLASGPAHLPAAAVELARGGWGIRDRRGFLTLAAIATLDNATRVAFLTFAAFLMIQKGVAPEWGALAVVVTLFGGMLGKTACGVMAERIGVTRTIAVTELATGLGIMLVVVTPSIYAFLLLPFLGIFLNGTSSAIYGTVGDLIEDGRHGRAFGLIYTLGSCCGIVAPIAYGLVSDRVGVSGALVADGFMVLLTLPLCLLLAASLSALEGGDRCPAEA